MSAYLIINLSVIIFPFMLSFDKKVRFYKKWPALFCTIAVSGILFIIWDILATRAGHWSFNHQYILDKFYIINLPLEEWLFFITVPYSCIFVYEVIKTYFKDKTFHGSRWLLLPLAALMLIPVIFVKGGYTKTVALAFALFIILATVLKKDFFLKKSFLLYILITFFLFVVINSFLTALPVVIYGPAQITGLRLGTIPIEDFFYNLTLLGFNLWLYQLFKKIFRPGDSV